MANSAARSGSWTKRTSAGPRSSRSDSASIHYRIEFTLASADLARSRVELDLGVVRDVAEIQVNGRRGPTLLLRPYRAEVTSLLRPGRNPLEVTVTNPPLNRLIGSGMRLGVLFAESYSRPPTRIPAGLLGPIRLLITPVEDTTHSRP